MNMIAFGMEPQAAIDAPRFCIDGLNNARDDGPDVGAILLEEGISPDVAEELRRMGHKVNRSLPDRSIDPKRRVWLLSTTVGRR